MDTVFAAMLVLAVLQSVDQKPNTPASGAPRAVVLTGCIAAPAKDRARADYMLINASPVPSASDQARTGVPETGSTGVGTTGTGTSGSGSSATPTTAQDAAQVTVILRGSVATMKPHVGRRVEVQGTMRHAAEAQKPNEPGQLQVAKIRRVPGSCGKD